MTVELREGDFDAFFAAPFACYGDQTHFVSPMKGDLARALDAAKNPLFRQFARRTWYTAHRDGQIVGRILAHVHDASNRRYGQKRGYFGLFDCIDDIAVARALLDAAAGWASRQGCDELAGSFNLTITQMIGIVTDGFGHAPYTYQEYTPPHIARLLEACGFERFFPMRTFEMDVRGYDPEQLLGDRQRALASDPDWRFAPIRRRGFEGRLREACAVLNDGFAGNPMFVPLTEAEFLYPCAGMMWIIDERLSYTAYYRGEPAGVLLCVPDLNPFLRATGFRLTWSTLWHLLRFRASRKRAAVIFFSVRQAFHGQGVNGVLLHRLLTAMRDAGYSHLGISWVSDTNGASLRQMEKLGATELHRLHLFRRALAPENGNLRC
ncbi:GNAT family N-acetyltransferase [Cupriavidus sp. L7L]|uniref:GNAT family N-acetyltransferase n=1 Tax=Cupriavidus sp. L7L TaxID=2546443 RepID=UPI0010554F65|nr:GNAT family N-acetyltransferase [Cupriavidus sp. L7L]TDF65576.1 GNAT family N-acetyltransferase [Cupriavidus sp. L7L]